MLRRKNTETQTPSKPEQATQTKRAKLYTDLLAENKRGKVVIGIGVDIGTGNLTVAVHEKGGVSTIIESPIDGTAVPTCFFEDPKSGQAHFGSDAINRAYDAPGNLAMHVKRALAKNSKERIYCDGKYNAIEVTTKLLDHAVELLLNTRPDLKEYKAFGGTQFSAEEMVIILTTPADWGVEEHAALKEAALASGFRDFDGFIAEPTAAARSLAHVSRVHLQNGNHILTFDIGAGTSDFVVNKYSRGVFNQIVRASGDGLLGGHDFTNVLAKSMAKDVGVSWEGVCGEGGFNLATVKKENREAVIEIWNKAEKEVKPRLALMDSVDVALNLPNGRKRCTVTRAQAEKLWSPLFSKLEKCIAKALDGSQLTFKDIDYFLLVGGSAALHKMSTHVAKAVGCDESELIVCKDSAHVIAVGGSEHAFFQQDSSQALPGGMGFKIRTESGGHANTLFIEPGQILTSDGFYVEKSGFYVKFTDGSSLLQVEPFCVKNGVRTKLLAGQDTNLADTEAAYLEPIVVTLEGWPPGEHDIDIGVSADANRNLVMLIRATNLPDVEVLAIPLDAASKNSSTPISADAKDIVMMLDCSISMGRTPWAGGSLNGQKIKSLKKGANAYVQEAIAAGHRVGIVPFPSEEIVQLTRDTKKLQKKIAGLKVDGGTPTNIALYRANELLKNTPNGVGVLYTDGHPNDRNSAFVAANKFKSANRLICVGIGKDVCRADLIEMATCRDDYIDVTENPSGIIGSFQRVSARINSRSSKPAGTNRASSPAKRPGAGSPTCGAQSQRLESDGHESWDDIEGLGEEVA